MLIELPKSITLALALGLSVSTIHAEEAVRSGENMIPAGSNGAIFLNIKQVRESFGAILNEGRSAEFFDSLVARGLPDLRKDVEEAAAAFNFDGDEKQVSLVARGKVDSAKLVEAIRAQFNGQVTEEAYRGVIIKTVAGEGEKASFQVAAHDENLTMLSVDEKREHKLAKPSLDVLAGRLESYGAVNHITLPQSYMLAATFALPEEVRASLARNPLTQPLAAVKQATGALKVVPGDSVRFDLTGRCDTDLQATALKFALEAFRAQILASGRLDEQTRKLLEQMTIVATGPETTLSIEVPRNVVEDILRSFVAAEKA